MPRLQPGQLAGRGVGRQALVAPAVDASIRVSLRAGVGAFAADQDPHPGRPAGLRVTEEAGEVGDLSHRQPRLIHRPGFPAASIATVHADSGSCPIASLTVLVTRNPTENDTPAPRWSRRPRR